MEQMVISTVGTGGTPAHHARRGPAKARCPQKRDAPSSEWDEQQLDKAGFREVGSRICRNVDGLLWRREASGVVAHLTAH